MRALLSLLLVATTFASSEVDLSKSIANIKSEELFNGSDEPPAQYLPIIDTVLDNLQPKIDNIRALSNETRLASGEMIKTIFDFETPRKLRSKRINELLKKLDYKDQEGAVKMTREIVAATNDLEKTYPIVAKEFVTLAVDLLLHEDFLNGSRDEQRRLFWKLIKTFVSKIITDERIQKELKNGNFSAEEFLN